MASEYKSYLAANVLNEDRVITYRLLSRALKVNVNKAKEMLFEFHRLQNGKKPGTVHATYLVAGIRRRRELATATGSSLRDFEDEHMQSSPFRSSPAHQMDENIEESPVISVTLVREENLNELRSTYESISSIHIYSLATSPVKVDRTFNFYDLFSSLLAQDLQVLSNETRDTIDIDSNEDPLEMARTYGTIVNMSVRRRKGKRPPFATAPSAASISVKSTVSKSRKLDVVEEISLFSSTGVAPQAKVETNSSQPARNGPSKRHGEQRNASSNPAPLRRDSSNIFKSFAKAKPKLKREATDSSAATSVMDSGAPSGLEDESMKETSEEDEEDYVLPPQLPLNAVGGTDRKDRKEREAALRKMMDDDEEEDKQEDKQEAEELADSPEKSNSQNAIQDISKNQPNEEAVQITGGRRRGRRRIMKKKTIKDEEGYLVTKEEPVWESFSEDEPAMTKAKIPSSTASSTDKPKKGPGKPGQGNIMSFFGKK